MTPITTDYKGYIITTDKSLLKPGDIHKWLSTQAYWCKDIPFETVQTAFDHSYCIGALYGDKQVAYARLITDYATYGYLADVYVEEGHRGQGISKKMLEMIFEQDWVQKLRHVALATRDAHRLYEQIGFYHLKNPERYMQILRTGIYEQHA